MKKIVDNRMKSGKSAAERLSALRRIPQNSWRTSRGLVIGMGKTGLSMARFLLWDYFTDGWGVEVHAVDTRKKPPMAAEMCALLGEKRCYIGENFRKWTAEQFDKFDFLCVSPGVPPQWLKRAGENAEPPEMPDGDDPDMCGAYGEIALLQGSFESESSDTVPVMITGTNGKSTVAALVAALCRVSGISAQVVGNFGYPLLDAWREWRDMRRHLAPWENVGAPLVMTPQVAVVELSSFQLQYVSAEQHSEFAPSFGAHAAAVLNVSPDHLDYHKDLAEYAEVKSRIYNFAGYGVINLDDPIVARMRDNFDGTKAITFSAREKADWYLDGDDIIGDGMRFSRRKISPALTVENALAGLALFSALMKPFPLEWAQYGVDAKWHPTYKRNMGGVEWTKYGVYGKWQANKSPSAEALAWVLAEFPGLPHRRQKIYTGGIWCINDSKATNVESACFALRNISGNIILIAGGDGKGQDFAPLAAACANVKKVFLIGKDAPRIRDSLIAKKINCEIVADMKAAVRGAIKIARADDTILLSPACSSLDLYRDYAARGDDFMNECRAAARGEKGRGSRDAS